MHHKNCQPLNAGTYGDDSYAAIVPTGPNNDQNHATKHLIKETFKVLLVLEGVLPWREAVGVMRWKKR